MISKSQYLRSALMITCVLMISCVQKKEDAKNIAEQKNKELFDDPAEKENAQFLVNITEMELQQIKLSKLATENSINPKVKSLANEFLNIHIKHLYEIRNIAAKRGVALPAAITKKEEEDNNKMSFEIADDFDRLFFDATVKNYKAMISKCEISSNSKDEEIRLLAIKSLPAFRKNLGTSLVYQASLHKKKLK